MNTCGTCKHWNQRGREDWMIVVEPARYLVAESEWKAREKAADEADMHYGQCRAIEHGRVELGDEPMPLAITMDGSDYRSALYTRENFGCVLHEPRDDSPETAVP